MSKRPFMGYAPDVTDDQSGPRWERAYQRVQAIGPITPGHPLYIEGRTLAEQCRILQRENHPLHPSVKVLSAWRTAYLAGGRSVKALLDNDRGGKGKPRGWLKPEEHKALAVGVETDLIKTNRTEYPSRELVRAQLVKRVGAELAKALPCARTLGAFLDTALTRAERSKLVGGARRYREKVMPKPLTRRANRFGEIWVGDNRKTDFVVLYKGKEIRMWVAAIIDLYSGLCVAIYISAAEMGSTEIAIALRDGILRWGCPDVFYCDWGKDYASTHLRVALTDEIKIQIQHAQPHSPWAKGTVEGNFFGTMSKRCDPTFDGYLGRNAKERLPGVKAVLQYEAAKARVEHWALVEFNNLIFQKKKLNGQPASRLDFARAHRIPVRRPQEDTLLLCLMKRERRTVGSSGISLGGLCSYWNNSCEALWALAEERAEIELRFDPREMWHAYVFHHGEFVCEVTDQTAEGAQLTEGDVRERVRRQKVRAKAQKVINDPKSIAAMQGETFLEELKEERALELPVAAVAGGGSVTQLVPGLDHAAKQLRQPGRPRGGRVVELRKQTTSLPDLADKALPEGWES